MDIDTASPMASAFRHPLDSAKVEAAKIPKRKKSGKAGRASFTLKLPKFESPQAEADFMMYTFKVALCTRRRRHTWSGCPYAHPGETARRRDPRTHCAVPCPEMKQGQKCPRGDRCPYSHHDFEYWLHPTRYRTVACNKSGECNRSLCFFYHSPEEQRTTSSQTNSMLPSAMSDIGDPLGPLKVAGHEDVPPPPVCMLEEGMHSDDGEGDSVDSVMDTFLTRQSFKSSSFNSNRSFSKSSSFNSTRSFSKSNSFNSTFSNPSQACGTPKQVSSLEALHNSSMRMHVPVQEKLASMQIQTLLAKAVKVQNSGSSVGRGSSPSSTIQASIAPSPSTRSHGSGSPTSTHASAMGGALSDDVMDTARGGFGLGTTPNAGYSQDKSAQMNDFLARRQSAPVAGMSYASWAHPSGNNAVPKGLSAYTVAENSGIEALEGMLISRGTWNPTIQRSVLPSPRTHIEGTPQSISEILSSGFGMDCEAGNQPPLTSNPTDPNGLLSSPFLSSPAVLDIVNQARLAPCWEVAQPHAPAAQPSMMEACLNGSFSLDIPQGNVHNSWGIAPLETASSCLFPGMLGMEGQ